VKQFRGRGNGAFGSAEDNDAASRSSGELRQRTVGPERRSGVRGCREIGRGTERRASQQNAIGLLSEHQKHRPGFRLDLRRHAACKLRCQQQVRANSVAKRTRRKPHPLGCFLESGDISLGSMKAGNGHRYGLSSSCEHFTSPMMGEVAAKLQVGVTFGCLKDHPTPALGADRPHQG
jgi:hypothetical protein